MKWRISLIVSVVVLCFLLPGAEIFAGGAKESKGDPANGLANWDKTYDINGKKAGRYNVVVEGHDQAGNLAVAGPFNIWIDPKSDIPIVTISNPSPGMRVGTNLNIVGTVVDDDGVARVEVSLDGGSPVTAKGTDFWSYYLPVDSVADGPHRLSVQGFDINGTPSKIVSVSFNLDKAKPTNDVSSHESGAIVAGPVTLKGSVTDANGVAQPEAGLDESPKFSAVRISPDKSGTSAAFTYGIDTKKLEDGPHVVWLRSKDKTGSVGISAFLLFVDNTRPSLTVLSPKPDQAVHGQITVVAEARDTLGIRKLTWSFGTQGKPGYQGGSIDLAPGNPYFSFDLDLSRVTDKSARVRIETSNPIGNSSTLDYAIKVDPIAAQPVVSLGNLKNGDIRTSGTFVTYRITQDRQGGKLHYSFDTGATSDLDALPAGVLSIPELSGGKHSINLWAETQSGLIGPKTTVSFMVRGPGPSIALDAFNPGTEFDPSTPVAIQGSLVAENTLSSSEFSINGGPWSKLAVTSPSVQATKSAAGGQTPASPGAKAFSFALPPTTPYGIVTIAVRARDVFGLEAQAGTFIHLKNLSAISAEPTVDFYDARVGTDGTLRIANDKPLVGSFYGANAASVRLNPPSDLVDVSLAQGLITVSAKKSGIGGPSRVVVTSDKGHDYSSQEFRFVTDSSAPVIAFSSPAPSSALNGSFTIAAKAGDDSGLASVSVSLDGESTWADQVLRPGAASYSLSLPVTVAALGDGPHVIALRARDTAGNESKSYLPILIDSTAPQIGFDGPTTPGPGQNFVYGHVQDSGGPVSLSYKVSKGDKAGPEDYQDLGELKNFVIPVDLGDGPTALTVKATDSAGNTSESTQVLNPSASGSPQAPASGAKVQASLVFPTALARGKSTPVISLVNVVGFDSVQWSLDGQKPADALPYIRNGLFAPPLDLSAQKGPSVGLTLSFAGAKGKRDQVQLKLPMDPSAGSPVAQVFWTSGDKTISAIWIQSQTSNPVVHWTHEGKEDRSLDAGAVRILDVSGLDAGKHSVSVWAVSTEGIVGAHQDFGANVTGPAPSIRLGTIGLPKGERDFVPGVAVAAGDGLHLLARATFASSLAQASWQLNGGSAQVLAPKASGKEVLLDLPLGKGPVFGRNTLSLTVRDGFDQTSVENSYFFLTGPSRDGTKDEGGIYFLNDEIAEDGTLHFGSHQDLHGVFVGRTIAAVSLVPAQEGLDASFDGQTVLIHVSKPIIAKPVVLKVVDKDGDSYTSRTLIPEYDPDPPQPSLDADPEGTWVGTSLSLKGSVKEDLSLASFSYAIRDPGAQESADSYSDIAYQNTRGAASNSYAFSTDLDLSTHPDGLLQIVLRAVDTYGNIGEKTFVIVKDTIPPALALISPPVGVKVNGLTSLIGTASDSAPLSLLEFSTDGKQWKSLDGIFRTDLDLTANPPQDSLARFRATDAAGNVSVLEAPVTVDAVSDVPTVRILTPQDGEVLRNDFLVSGVAYDDDGIAALYYRLDYKEPKPPAPSPAASAPVPGARSAPSASPSAQASRSPTATSPQPSTASQKAAANQSPAPSGASAQQAATGTATASPAPKPTPPDLSTFTKIDGKTSFGIPLKYLEVGDNEHSIEIVAQDINGLLSEPVKSTFRISTAEPTSVMSLPGDGAAIRGLTEFSGTAADANGIQSISVSFDNGANFMHAKGTDRWSYELDSSTLSDGPHLVIVKAVDGYGTEGLYTSLTNVDNTAPVLSLDSPADGEKIAGLLSLNGRMSDNIGLKSAHLSIVPANDPIGVQRNTVSEDIDTSTVVQKSLDVSGLPPGWYTLRVEGRDGAGNLGYVSRNVLISPSEASPHVDILYPLEGEDISGQFTISGRAQGLSSGQIAISVDGAPLATATLGNNGYFSVAVPEGGLTDGQHSLQASFSDSASAPVVSAPRRIGFSANGPWISVDSARAGDYETGRPFISGKAGYSLPEVPKGDPAYKDYLAQLKAHQVNRVEISLDNGITWKKLSDGAEWKYRLETENFSEGPLYVTLRASTPAKDEATVRTLLVVDKTPPAIAVLKPSEEGRYNQTLTVVGTAHDNYALQDLSVELRAGDKANYEVPTFIQGLYLTGQALGGMTWQGGLGLTFFDDNVKLEVLGGQSPPDTRFDGYGLGAKIIANVAYLPFSYLFGPDWSFFSMSLGVGAQFDYFTMSGDKFNFDNQGVVLGAALVQLEFARFHFSGLSVFRTISAYTELQAWFISSDVMAGVEFKESFGLRVNVF